MKKSLLMILTIIMSLFILTEVTTAKELDINSNEVKELYEKIPIESDIWNDGAYKSDVNSNYVNSNYAILQKSIDRLNARKEITLSKNKATCDDLVNSGVWELIDSDHPCENASDDEYPVYNDNYFYKLNINKSNLSSEVKKIIGKENEANFKYTSFYSEDYVCALNNDEFICYSGYHYCTVGSGNAYTKIESAENNNDVITIYDKYVFHDYAGISNAGTGYYTSYDLKKIITKYNDGIENFTIDNFEKTYGEGSAPTYMHTFKKDSEGNYYWESTKLYKDTIGVKEVTETKKQEKIEVPNTGIINVYTISSVIILGAVILFIAIKRKSEMM